MTADLKRVVEQQSGACRALAMSLENYADNGTALLPEQRDMIRGYALVAKGVADALTTAVAKGNNETLEALWRYGGTFVAGLAAAAASGLTEGSVGLLFQDDPPPSVVVCIQQVAEGFEADLGIGVEPTASIVEEQSTASIIEERAVPPSGKVSARRRGGWIDDFRAVVSGNLRRS